VKIIEAGPRAGGMMRFGIPKYRLPRDVLDGEVARILEMGVELELDRKVSNILDTMKEGRFDAAFLAVGAHIAKRAYIPAGEAAHMLDAVSVLRSMDGEEKPMLGRRVVVYGGGNTALDVARTAKRLGASEAIIVYPPHAREDAGARFRSRGGAAGRRADQVAVDDTQHVRRGHADRSRRWRSTTKASRSRPASSKRWSRIRWCWHSARTSILSLLDGVPGLTLKDGTVVVEPNMMTGHPGIFAGGDMVPSERTVTVGVGHGKKAARHIDAWLRDRRYEPAPKHELATFDKLNTWYYTDAPKTVRPMLDLARRTSTFDEVVHGLDETNALYEARRCLSCGNCFECDNCYGVCPDNAVIKLGPASGSSSISTIAKAAASACRNARAAQSRWCPRALRGKP
jgi:NADPH-dependent glutamate synthase beta subunit-like oxidoreductase